MTPSPDGSAHRRVKDIFLEACALAGVEREAFLEQACGDDEELRGEVDDLLAADIEAEQTSPLNVSDFQLPSFDGYEVVRQVGAGGMGTVYEAIQKSPYRRVALKVVSLGLIGPEFEARFRFEAEILGRLNHSGIAQIYESAKMAASDGGRPFLSMEFVDGQPLNEFAAERKLSVRARLELVAKVCEAMEHAHLRGVIHRDLKPANILIGKDGEPKVVDFGIARSVERDHGLTSATQPGQILGTLPYMSPEQVRADPSGIDIRADVYSLGAIAYELLAGCLPVAVQGAGLESALMWIESKEPRRLGQVNRELRGDVEIVVAKALSKERERRYSSAGDFAADIRRYIAFEPILAAPPSALYRLRKFARRNRTLAGAIVAVLIALTIGGIGTLTGLYEARRQQGISERRFESVRDLGRFVVFDLDEQIRDLPQSSAVRARLVRKGLEYLDKLAIEAEGHAELTLDIVRGYQHLGELSGGQTEIQLGDTVGALESYDRAITLVSKLVESEPDNADARRELAYLQALKAMLPLESNQIEQQIVELENSATTLRQLLVEEPGHSETSRMLINLLQAKVAAQIRIADLDGVVELGEESVRLASGLSGDSVHCAYLTLGDARLAVMDKSGAVKGYEKAYRIASEGLSNPRPADLRNAIAACVKIGAYWMREGNYETARTYFALHLKHAKVWVSHDEFNARAREALSLGYVRVADVAGRMNHVEIARENYSKGLEISRELLKASPDSTEYLRSVLLASSRLADMTKRFSLMAPLFEEAHDVSRRLWKADPTSPRCLSDLALTLIKVGECDENRGFHTNDKVKAREHYAAALEHYRESRALNLERKRRGLLGGDPGVLEYCNELIERCQGRLDGIDVDALSPDTE